MRSRVSPPVAVAIALPLLLAVAVAAIAITARVRGLGEPPPPATGPLAVAPVDAPGSGGPECAALLAALPPELPASDGALVPRPVVGELAGVRAWAAAPRPVVLRCGLPRPAELTPTSALLEVNGVRWLQIGDGLPEPVQVSYIAVDRPVYVAVTTPIAMGSGPLQTVSDAVRATLPTAPVAVREN